MGQVINFPRGDYNARKLGQFFAGNPAESLTPQAFWNQIQSAQIYENDLEALAGIGPNQCSDRYISQLLAVTRRELSDERKARFEAERLLRLKEREAK